MLIGGAKVRFGDTRNRVDVSRDVIALTPIQDRVIPVNWEESQEPDISMNDLEKTPTAGLPFEALPAAAFKAKSYAEWQRDFSAWIFGHKTLGLLRSPSLGQVSAPNEDERDFRVRLAQISREQRDLQVDALRKKYASRINTLEEKVRRAEQAVQREADQASQAKVQTALSFGATLLGAFTGRKIASATNINKAASALKGVGRSAQQQSDVARAKETVESYKKQLEDLTAEFEQEAENLAARIDSSTESLEPLLVKPKKTDIDVRLVALAWAPFRTNQQGQSDPAW
jgi:hypothetical protein